MNQVEPEEKTEVTTFAAIRNKANSIKLQAVNAGFFDLQSFELMQRVAKGFSASTLVPKAYQGGSVEAIGNCMIALNLARRIGADPLMVMQNLNVVQGRPTWSSQFLIASVNTCGRFTALRFEFLGEKGQDDWGCRAWATEKATGEVLAGADITIALAKKEGWFARSGSKWQSMPQQMLMYRAGAWWTKAYAPELSMGLMTADEADDIIDLVPQSYDHGTHTAPANEPQTIAARLDKFGAAKDDNSGSMAPASQEPEAPEAAPAPAPSASDEPAPSEATPSQADDDAGSPDLPPAIRDAMERGRAARRDGYTREVPRNLQYKTRADEADAFLHGWDEEDFEAKAEANGSV